MSGGFGSGGGKGLQRKTALQRKTPLKNKTPMKRTPFPDGGGSSSGGGLQGKTSGGFGDRSKGNGLSRKTPLQADQSKGFSRSPTPTKRPDLEQVRAREKRAREKRAAQPRKRRSIPSITAEERQCRAVVAERSENICEWCGRAGPLEKAHRIGRAVGGKWDPSNILDLCHDCHHGNHANPTEAYVNGWHLRGSTDDTEAAPVRLRKGMRVGWALLDDEGGYRWVEDL